MRSRVLNLLWSALWFIKYLLFFYKEPFVRGRRLLFGSPGTRYETLTTRGNAKVSGIVYLLLAAGIYQRSGPNK